MCDGIIINITHILSKLSRILLIKSNKERIADPIVRSGREVVHARKKILNANSVVFDSWKLISFIKEKNLWISEIFRKKFYHISK